VPSHGQFRRIRGIPRSEGGGGYIPSNNSVSLKIKLNQKDIFSVEKWSNHERPRLWSNMG
jgi:hypothetical protein